MGKQSYKTVRIHRETWRLLRIEAAKRDTTLVKLLDQAIQREIKRAEASTFAKEVDETWRMLRTEMAKRDMTEE